MIQKSKLNAKKCLARFLTVFLPASKPADGFITFWSILPLFFISARQVPYAKTFLEF